MIVEAKTVQRAPLLVGITGGLGCGKSSVSSIFAEMGCAVFEADKVAKELQLEDPEIVAGIKKLFGDEVYFLDKAGELALDRRHIARRVFVDSSLLGQLNELIHPKVFKAFQRAVQKASRSGVKILVKEAAILLESGGDKGLDMVVVVVADLDKRVDRAMKKGMGTREEIMHRIRSQWPQTKLVERADFVIENNGSLKELERAVHELYHKIMSQAELS